MDISVIIVSYNVREFLHQSLLSIEKAAAGLKVEIFVVDNASIDGTPEFVREHFPAVHLIANTENAGFGAANNQALREAEGNYILFLNPDTIIQEDTLSVMMDYMDRHPECGLSGCKILNADGSLQLACRRSFPTPMVTLPKMLGLSALFPKSPRLARYNLTFLDPEQEAEVDAVSGSFMFTRKELMLDLGAFDERFFMYGEDLDLCYRVKEAGYSVNYVPATSIIHYKGESSKQAAFDNILIFYKAMDVFVQKHFALRFSLPYTLMLRTGILTHMTGRFLAKLLKIFRYPLLDALFLYLSFVLALLLRFGDLDLLPNYLFITGLYFLIYSLAASGMSVYRSRPLDFTRSAAALAGGGLLSGFLTFFLPQIAHSRLVFLIAFSISLIFIPGWRLIVKLTSSNHRKSHADELLALRTAIVGADSEGQRIAAILSERPDLGYLFIGFLDRDFSNPRTVGRLSDIRELVQLKKLGCLIFTSSFGPTAELMSMMSELQDLDLELKIVPENLNMIYGKASIETLEGISMVEMEFSLHRPFNRGMKRFFDLSTSLVGLIIFAVPALGYRLFRGRRTQLLQSGPVRWTVWETPKGQRRGLWWYPLLFSVLKGNLSFVGDLWNIPEGSRRMYKPGLTGLAQMERDVTMDAQEHSRFMTFYLRNYSFSMDVEILLKTLFKLQ